MTPDYAQRLLDDMDQLEPGWPAEILTMQRNWIGRSEGAHIDFTVEGHAEPVRIFTTRPDTLFGATFFVIAFDAPLAARLCAPECREAFDAYVRQVSASTDIERLATDRTRTGVFLGRYAVNPADGERIPVYASDYVLANGSRACGDWLSTSVPAQAHPSPACGAWRCGATCTR